MYDPAKVRSHYKRLADAGLPPTACIIPNAGKRPMGRKWSRLGIPHGETRKSMEAKMSIVEKEILARMEELSNVLPKGFDLNPLLDEEAQKDTGIILNPAFFLQKLFAAGVLTVKEQLDVLKLLMEYTHTKKAQKTQLNVTSTPEAFLAAIASDMDEKVIDGQVIDESQEAIGD